MLEVRGTEDFGRYAEDLYGDASDVLEDSKTLQLPMEEGIVAPPQFVPPHFADLRGLTTWMSFSHFIASLNLDQLHADYGALL